MVVLLVPYYVGCMLLQASEQVEALYRRHPRAPGRKTTVYTRYALPLIPRSPSLSLPLPSLSSFCLSSV